MENNDRKVEKRAEEQEKSVIEGTRVMIAGVLVPEQEEVKRLRGSHEAMRSREGEREEKEIDENGKREMEMLEALSEEVAEIGRSLNPVEIITADNYKEAKKDFLAKVEAGDSEMEEPVFVYEKHVEGAKEALETSGYSLEEALATLERIESQIREGKVSREETVRIMRYALRKNIRDVKANLRLIEGLQEGDDKKIKTALGEKYGMAPDEKLVEAADAFYEDMLKKAEGSERREEEREGIIPEEIKVRMSQDTITSDEKGKEELEKLKLEDPERAKFYYEAEEIAEAFSWALEEYYNYYKEKTGVEFPEDEKYKVKVSAASSSIDVRDKSAEGKVIEVPENRIIDAKKLLELIAHEVEGHARQSLNGVMMLNGLGGGGLKVDDESNYEGLALSLEDEVRERLFGEENEMKASRLYYVYAVRAASEGKSFTEVYNLIREKEIRLLMAKGKTEEEAKKKSADTAWMPAYRAFRGHVDTKNGESYASAKDLAYFKGYLVHKQLEEVGLGYYNEAGVTQEGAMSLVARGGIEREDLLLPNLRVTDKYWREVMSKRLMG